MKTLLLALVATVFIAQPLFARPRSDLDKQFVEGAKNEKKLVFYTTMELPQTVQVVQEFVRKYPF